MSREARNPLFQKRDEKKRERERREKEHAGRRIERSVQSVSPDFNGDPSKDSRLYSRTFERGFGWWSLPLLKSYLFRKGKKRKKKRETSQMERRKKVEGSWRANRCMEIDKLNARIDSRGISVIAL